MLDPLDSILRQNENASVQTEFLYSMTESKRVGLP